jgi:glycosyltransferase involved in cell wall biosynthesis
LLLLNWRDPWHPRSGGAEHLTLRVLERLAAAGWAVEWFSGAYPGAAAHEERDGIVYVRQGSTATVHLAAARHYSRRRDFDIVVDTVNTIPFFTPLWGVNSIAFFHQLAREVWLLEGGALGPLGYAAEPFYLKPYGRTPLITVSQSTATSLRSIGLSGPLRILPIAVDEPADDSVPIKALERDIVVVGRVTPSKRIEQSLLAANLLRNAGWGGRLRIVGAGRPAYVDRLRALSAKLNLNDRVLFLGRVDDAERSRLLTDASLIWMTSVREGWGLVITEAARHGTPAVVYDVPGLRDAVVDGETGLVVPPDPASLSAGALRLFESFDQFANEALRRARPLSWSNTATAFAHAVTELSTI